MDTFEQFWIRRIAWTANKGRVDLRDRPHETAEEFLLRGGHITKCPSTYKEIPVRWAMPTHKSSVIGQTIYDWRM